MAPRKDEMSRAEQDRKSSDIRRDTQVRGSMGKPASGRESDTGSLQPEGSIEEETPDKPWSPL